MLCNKIKRDKDAFIECGSFVKQVS